MALAKLSGGEAGWTRNTPKGQVRGERVRAGCGVTGVDLALQSWKPRLKESPARVDQPYQQGRRDERWRVRNRGAWSMEHGAVDDENELESRRRFRSRTFGRGVMAPMSRGSVTTDYLELTRPDLLARKRNLDARWSHTHAGLGWWTQPAIALRACRGGDGQVAEVGSAQTATRAGLCPGKLVNQFAGSRRTRRGNSLKEMVSATDC